MHRIIILKVPALIMHFTKISLSFFFNTATNNSWTKSIAEIQLPSPAITCTTTVLPLERTQIWNFRISFQVSAEDKASGNKQQIVIRNDQKSMKPEDIERMVNDAEKFKEADKQVRSVRPELCSELRCCRMPMCYSCFDGTYVSNDFLPRSVAFSLQMHINENDLQVGSLTRRLCATHRWCHADNALCRSSRFRNVTAPFGRLPCFSTRHHIDWKSWMTNVDL